MEPDAITRILERIEQDHAELQRTLAKFTDTLDTYVLEKMVWTPGSGTTFDGTVQPQTTQVELITGVIASFYDPAISLSTGYVLLDDLHLTIPQPGGLGQTLVLTELALPLRSDQPRGIHVVTNVSMTPTSVISLAIMGRTVPTTGSGGRLH